MDSVWMFVSAAATVVIAVFAWLTWKVYLQIKDVMRESFESEFRPVVHVTANTGGKGRGPWRASFTLKNIGNGVACRVRLRHIDVNGKPGDWTDPDTFLGDLMPGDKKGTPSQKMDDQVPRFDIGYYDLYGNEFVTELRGQLLAYSRIE